jgi:hypothetical protein
MFCCSSGVIPTGIVDQKYLVARNIANCLTCCKRFGCPPELFRVVHVLDRGTAALLQHIVFVRRFDSQLSFGIFAKAEAELIEYVAVERSKDCA